MTAAAKTIADVIAERYRAEREYLIEEYQFMRSFGMGHDRAATIIGEDPARWRDRLSRHGLKHICN